jgi:hypothetical protein
MTSPQAESAGKRGELLAVAVGVKYRIRFAGWSWWSWKNLGGMGLFVTPDLIEVRPRMRVLSALLGTSWRFTPWQTHCEVSRDPSPWYWSREWVVLSTGEGVRDIVAITRSEGMDEIWSALVDAGVRADSRPPEG